MYLVLSLHGGFAAAQVSSLDWSAPKPCPSRTYVARRVHDLLAASRAPRNELTVQGTVRRVQRGRYRLALILDAKSTRAERSLEAVSCKSIADAAAWLIALAADPSLGGAAAAPDQGDVAQRADTPAVSAAPESTPATSAPPATQEPTRSQRSEPSEQANVGPRDAASREPRRPRAGVRTWWRAGVFAALWSAQLPAPQASVGARAGLGLGWLYSELRSAWVFARARAVAEGVEARFTTQQLGLATCPQWGNALRFGPCATLDALRTEGRARGVDETNRRALFWVAGGVSVQLGWTFYGRLELMLETGVQISLSARPRYQIEGAGQVSTAAPVGAYARLGVGLRSLDIVHRP